MIPTLSQEKIWRKPIEGWIFRVSAGGFLILTGDLQQPYYFFHRVDLHNELKKLATEPSLNAEERPVEIHLGSPVISCAPEEASITLKDGRTIQGDLIIGADGVNVSLSVLFSHVSRLIECPQ